MKLMVKLFQVFAAFEKESMLNVKVKTFEGVSNFSKTGAKLTLRMQTELGNMRGSHR